MGSLKKTIPSATFLSTGVDFIRLYQEVFNSINAIRGLDGIKPGVIVTRSDDTSISENGESLLNAFYRSLGLPAVREDALFNIRSEVINNADLSQNDTINYVSSANFPIELSPVSVRDRELALQSLSSTKSSPKITANIVDGMRFMLKPAQITDGISGNNEIQKYSIMPALVAGDVTIFPLSRRVCPAFYPGIFQDGSAPAARPFIESVIYNTLFATDDTDASKELRASIVEITGVSTASEQLKSKNILTLRFLQKAYMALRSAAYFKFETLNARDDGYKKVSYCPALKKSGPAVKQGYFDITYEELVSFLSEDSYGESLLLNLPKPEIDLILSDQKAELVDLDNFYNLIPYNIVHSEAEITSYKTDLFDSAPSKTMFADLVVEIASIDKAIKERHYQENLESQRVIRNNLEIVRARLEICTGTTTGISIFEILSFFIAFYLLSPKYLIGLLNPSSRERLRERKNSSVFSKIGLDEYIDSAASVEESVIQLQNLVKEQLNLAQSMFNNISGNKI